MFRGGVNDFGSGILKPGTKFSFVVFLPIFIGLILVILLLLPSELLMFLISVSDPSISWAKGVKGLVWGVALVGTVAVLFLTGRMIFSAFSRQVLSIRTLWISVWTIFTIFSFVLTWAGASILTSIGASDYGTGEFFMMTAKFAGTAMVGLQVGIFLWLFMAKRILGNMKLFNAS